MECRARRQQNAGTGTCRPCSVSTNGGERHAGRDVKMHLLVGLDIETAALPGTIDSVGEGKVFRHIIVVISQFEA